MARRAAVSAINLIHGRGFLNRWSHKSGILSPLFSLFSSEAFQPKQPIIDFSCVKEVDDVIELFHKMKSMRPEPSVHHYSKLMSASLKIEQYCFALYVFDEMLRMGVPVDNYIMSIAVNCCCLLKDIYSAFAIIGFFLKRGYEPDVVTFGTLILDGLCRICRITEALAFLRVMEAKGVNPNIITCGVLINGLCKGRRLDEAIRLFNHLPSMGLNPNVQIYSMMLDSLYNEGREGEARRLMEEMERSGCAPDSVTFNIIVWNLVKSEKVHEAIPFLEEMCRRGFVVNSEIISALRDELRIREGKDEKLQEIVEKVCAQN